MNRYRIIPIEKIEKWYDISNQGYLVSKSTGEHVYGTKNKYGYLFVYFKELQTSFLVHRIVISKFIPDINESILQVNHKDLNKANNKLDNLEWVNSQQNVIHSYSNQKYRQKKPNFLDENSVIALYKELMNGGSTTELSKKYGISKSTVTKIKYKKVYKDVLDIFPDIPKSTSRTKITKDQIELIKQQLEFGKKPCEISKEYNIPKSVIIDYKNGRIFQNNTPVTKKFMGGEKLKEEQVLSIIELYKQGRSVDYLSDTFNVCKTSIKNIINKKTWKYITKDIQI